MRGAPDAAANRGRICPKGATLAQMMDTPDRTLYPLVRDDRRQPFRRATWEEATSLIANRLGSVISEHGPDSLIRRPLILFASL